MKILYDKSNLNDFINDSNLSIVYFSSSWCISCKKIYEDLEYLETKYKNKLNFLKVDVDEFPGLKTKYNIKSVPTFLYYKNGKLYGKVESSILSRIKLIITILLN